MNKLFTSMLALAMMGVASPALAQESGDYYLYDESAGLFLSRGASWGTEATADKYGVPFTWNSSTGIINFKDWGGVGLHIENNGTSVYTDNGSPTKFAFTATGDGYYLQNGDKTSYASHESGSIGEHVKMTTDASKAVVWKLLTKEQRDAIVNAYPEANKAAAGITGDVSQFISTVAQTIAPNSYTWTKSINRGNANSSDPREVYEGCGNFTYTVAGLSKGKYKIAIQAFERDGWNGDNVTLGNSGYFVTTSYLKAGNQQVRIKGWAEDRISDSNPNSVSDAKAAFADGRYVSELYVDVPEDNGSVDLTVAVPSFKNGHWFIMGNTVVYRLITSVTEAESNKLLETAQTLAAQPMNKDAKTPLTKGITDLSGNKTSPAYYQALSNAITAAQKSVTAYANAKAALESRAKLLTYTNFYKADDSFYKTPKAAFDAGTLADAEASALENPYATSKIGWHASSQLNKFFGAAWGFSDYSGSLYINTWSTEGDTDGSNFKVPFYEYWTGDGNTLADHTLTSTLSGLKPNTVYDVTAAVRVRLSNGKAAPATGITMQVGNNSKVNITGTQVGTSQMYLDNYTATGLSDADGNLELKFNISGTNVSWLSFQHVKYVVNTSIQNSKSDLLKAVAEATEANTTINSKDLTDAIAKAQKVVDDMLVSTKDVAEATNTLKRATRKAETTHGANVTFHVVNPSFESGVGTGWTQDGSVSLVLQGNNSFGKDGSHYAELWQPNGTLNIFQTVDNLPAGIYNVTARVKARGVASAAIYANDNESPVTIANSEADYTATVQVAENGSVKLGFKAEGTGAGSSWIALDNFRLTYLYSSLTDLTPEARKMNNDTKAAQDEAVKAYNADKSFANLNAALTAIDAAKASADAYEQAKNTLDDRAYLLSKANFHGTDASYYDEPLAAYEAGTMTDAEAKALENPYAVTAWHGSKQTSKFFGAAWGNTGYDSGVAVHVNTWSTEGDTDGSYFKVPFYEYWVSDANTLADNTLTGTVEGLKPNKLYSVAADVRVQVTKDDSSYPHGITMQVGDGTPVEIYGIEVSGTQRFIDTYVATGYTDENGTLTFKFNVSGTNVSWLSFQHVKYEELSATSIDSINAADGDANAPAYNLAGQRVGKSYKGVVIMNGKKLIRK